MFLDRHKLGHSGLKNSHISVTGVSCRLQQAGRHGLTLPIQQPP